MDPDVCLSELRLMVVRSWTSEDQVRPVDYARFAELFHGLDLWLTRGGFLPVSWRAEVPMTRK